MKILTRYYWILRATDEKTICITTDKEVAEWILNTYPEECIMRWEEH